jgi:gamma-glutamylcyclotransferase (GGCT)/AIG2-like uncharacterized protein YtfP
VRDFLFAYGTLITGAPEPRVSAVVRRHCRMGQCAYVPGRLIDLGSYPGALKSNRPEQRIGGRIIELLAPERTLPVLDDYEDYRPDNPSHSLYVRKRTVAQLEDGGTVVCWIYWLARPPRKFRMVPGGDWQAWRTIRRPDSRR